MSKRLRASMRVGNKGRNLRPRASQPAGAPSQPPEQEFDRPTGDSSPPLLTALSETPLAEFDPASVDTPIPAPPRATCLEIPRVAAVNATPASVEQTVSMTHLSPTTSSPSVEPVAPKVEVVPTTSPAVPLEAREEEATPAVVAAGPTGEATPGVAAGVPLDVPPVEAVNRPVEAVAPTVIPLWGERNEPRRAEGLASPAASRTAKPAELKQLVDIGEPGPPAASRHPLTRQDRAAASRHEAIEREPAKARSNPKIQALIPEEIDPSAISAEFFARDDISVPPVEELDEPELAPEIMAAATARRARLRGIVAGVVAFAAVLSVAVVGKALVGARPLQGTAAPAPAAIEAREQTIHANYERPVPATTPEKAPAEPTKVAPKVEEKKVDAKSGEKPVEEKKADDARPVAGPSEARALQKETEILLNQRRAKDAIGKAREAIAADPNEAIAYLYLGSALQDTGKWKDALQAYSDCVRTATKGPVQECRAMGGHK